MCKYELPTSRLLKVIVLQTDGHTERQTESTKIIKNAASRGWSVTTTITEYTFLFRQKVVTSQRRQRSQIIEHIVKRCCLSEKLVSKHTQH